MIYNIFISSEIRDINQFMSEIESIGLSGSSSVYDE